MAKPLTPDEASKQHVELFQESQAKFRNLFNDMEAAIADSKKKSEALDEKGKEVEQLKLSARNIERKAEDKLKDVEQKLEAATATLNDANTRFDEANNLLTANKATEEALNRQKDELSNDRSELAERVKQIDIDDRAVRFRQARVDRLIQDNQIKEMMKKDNAAI